MNLYLRNKKIRICLTINNLIHFKNKKNSSSRVVKWLLYNNFILIVNYL